MPGIASGTSSGTPGGTPGGIPGGSAWRLPSPRRGRARGRVVGCLAAILALVAAFLLVEPVMREPLLRSMLYPAPPVPVGEPPPGISEVWLEGEGGARQHAWAGGSPSPGRPAVLVFHGNGENLATMAAAGFFARLDRLDVAWLAVDYPGYGRSEGRPGETSVVAGAEAGLDHLRRAHPDRPAVVLGWSLGAAVAMQLAARRDDEVDGLLLLSPWSRLADVAAAHFPGFLARPVVGDGYDSLAAAARTGAPALVVHGARDRIIPASQGRELADALAERDGGESRWVEVPHSGHNDLLAGDAPWHEMAAFLDRRSRP